MTKPTSYDDLLNAPPASRKKVAEDLYDQRHEIRAGKIDRLPAKRRLKRIEFKQMSAVQLDFSDAIFDWAVSTSMIEHLHPDDVDIHLSEVRRILKAGGHYLTWCPNGLGHHDDRDIHLTMLSYSEWMEKLAKVGFCRFRSTLTSRLPLVDARWKIFLEKVLLLSRLNIMWSHLGVRNVLLVATK